LISGASAKGVNFKVIEGTDEFAGAAFCSTFYTGGATFCSTFYTGGATF
jgi:hypothetical protein